MKILDCLRIANSCDLTTISEAFLNIILHRSQLFSYEDMSNEVTELVKDYLYYGLVIVDNIIEKMSLSEAYLNVNVIFHHIKKMSLQECLELINVREGTSCSLD